MAILSNTEFGILRLTISRAQKRNSINAEMFDTMTEALSRAASDDAVRVVLLQGGEQIFSAGADLEEMRSQPEVLDRAMTNFFAALRAFPKPVVAQVMGPCVGDALSMLLYCDLVYASERALFSLPCVALGQTTRFGSAFIMAAAAGLPRATEKLMLSEPITAAEALEMRIITGIAAQQGPRSRRRRRGSRLAPPGGIRRSGRSARCLPRRPQARLPPRIILRPFSAPKARTILVRALFWCIPFRPPLDPVRSRLLLLQGTLLVAFCSSTLPQSFQRSNLFTLAVLAR